MSLFMSKSVLDIPFVIGSTVGMSAGLCKLPDSGARDRPVSDLRSRFPSTQGSVPNAKPNSENLRHVLHISAGYFRCGDCLTPAPYNILTADSGGMAFCPPESWSGGSKTFSCVSLYSAAEMDVEASKSALRHPLDVAKY